MDCKEFREVLDLYMDHELSIDALAAAQIHVSECGACRRAERELVKLRQGLKLLVSQPQPPLDLVQAVQGITNGRPWWRANVQLPVPIFALLLIAVFTFGVVLMSRPEAPTTRHEQLQLPPEAIDFSRFDRGGRASLYKVRRSDD